MNANLLALPGWASDAIRKSPAVMEALVCYAPNPLEELLPRREAKRLRSSAYEMGDSTLKELRRFTPTKFRRVEAHLPSLVEAFKTARGIGLGKAWELLHYLLTGRRRGGASPLSLAVLGGRRIGPDLGYGCARYVSPDQVVSVARALSAVSVPIFKKRFDLDAINAARVYPGIWEREELAEVTSCFKELKAFYRRSARSEQVVLQYLL